MKKGNQIKKAFRNLSLLFVITLGLVSIIGTGGGGGGGGDGSTSLATGEFTKTVTLNSNIGWASPFNAPNNRHLQQLYLASDINGAGYIQSIELRLNTATAGCSSDATIKMGHTSLGVLTNTFANNVEQGKGTLETVRTGAFSVPAGSAGDYFTIILDTPFLYNGVDNLVVEFLVTTYDADIFLWVDNTAVVHRMLNRSDDLTAATGDLYMYILHTRFNFEGGTNTIISADKTGDNANDIAPGYTGRTQMLLLAEDIAGSGPITGLSIFPNGATTTATEISSISVSMVHVAATSLTNTFADNYEGNTPVTVAQDVSYNIDVGQSAAVCVPFNVANFTYDGASNLLIDISATVPSGGYRVDYKNVPGIRVVSTLTPTAVTGSTRSRAFEPVLRFNGGTMDVITAEDADLSVPFSNLHDYKLQIMFGAQQFGTGGPVTGVSLRLGADSLPSDYPAATLVLGHTPNTVLSMTFADNMTDPTTVYTGTFTIPAGLKAGDWVTFPVSGFTYDPTQNLVVEVNQDAGTANNETFGTLVDIPGASGLVLGDRGDLTAFEASPGQSDIRIHLSK